jgi:hypothetical protein
MAIFLHQLRKLSVIKVSLDVEDGIAQHNASLIFNRFIITNFLASVYFSR